MLEFLREHPQAPIFRNQSGNRLTADDLARVREFEREVREAEVGWRPGRVAFVDRGVCGAVPDPTCRSIGVTVPSRLTFMTCPRYRAADSEPRHRAICAGLGAD